MILKPHSYKELPIRIAEFGTVYRYEQSGELTWYDKGSWVSHKMMHIFFVQSDQVKDEVYRCYGLNTEGI